MKIKVGYSEVTVRFTNLLDERGCYGEFWERANLIEIEKSLTGPILVTTLTHELFHWFYSIYRPRGEEQVVTVLSNLYIEALQRNKKLNQLIQENL